MKSRLMIFGAGGTSKRVLAKIGNDFDLVGYLDNSPKLWGKQIAGVPIYKADEITTLEFDIVAIAALKGVETIRAQLCALGVDSSRIIVPISNAKVSFNRSIGQVVKHPIPTSFDRIDEALEAVSVECDRSLAISGAHADLLSQQAIRGFSYDEYDRFDTTRRIAFFRSAVQVAEGAHVLAYYGKDGREVSELKQRLLNEGLFVAGLDLEIKMNNEVARFLDLSGLGVDILESSKMLRCLLVLGDGQLDLAAWDFGLEHVAVWDNRRELDKMLQWLNANTVDLWKHGLECLSWGADADLDIVAFESIVDEAKVNLERNGIPLSDVAVTSGGIMRAYGIKPADDVDLIIHSNYRQLYGPGLVIVSDHVEIHPEDEFEVPDDLLISEPANHFYFRGLKFVSLERLYDLRKGQAFADASLIEAHWKARDVPD